MGSNSLAAFLSKLLKPDRKDNVPSAHKSKVLKRHSAPVPNGFDVTNPAHIPPPAAPKTAQSKSNRRQRGGILEQKQGEEIQNAKADVDKKNRQDKKQKKNVSKENVQNVPMRKAVDGSDKENGRGNKDKSSRTRKTTRRHSTGLAYWFCVSGNADTLERGLKAPFPQDRKTAGSNPKDSDKNAKKRELSSIPEQRQLNDKGGTPGDVPKPVNLAGVIRRDGKKKKGDRKNRHSAPPDTLAVFRPKERPLTPNQYQDLLTHREERSRRRGPDGTEVAPSPTRSMSPGVRYRVDGTLERPYVFPSALTFGAEGRKLHLKSSDVSPVHELENPPRSNLSASTSMVLAEVHNHVCESENHEKRVGSESNIADISYDDFDVRKTFYLKYDRCDSQQTPEPANYTRLCRHSMPMFPLNFDVMNAHLNGGTGVPETPPTFDANDTHHSQPLPVRQRYSMPPKNDEFVYMGSRENLNVWSEFVDRQGLEINNAVSQNETEAAPRKRYSSPVHNRDYVYMGSIENIHLLNVGDKRAGCMSLKRDADGLFPPADSADPPIANGDPGIANSSISDDENQKGQVGVTQPTSVQGDSGAHETVLPMHKKRHQLEEHHHSLPELCLHHDRRLSRNVHSESGALEDDVDMDKENPPGAFSRNPFARNLGRSSCMPGNKKSFAPPPAIFSQSDGTIQIAETTTASEINTGALGKFSNLPGNRKFKLPPPPNYTPPREEMEEVQAKLSECHKGSQTDLQDRALYCVNMEDRDMSLSKDQAKTIQSSVSVSEPPEALANDLRVNDTIAAAVKELSETAVHVEEKSRPKNQAQIQRILNASTSSQGSDDVFKDGSASETMGQPESLQQSRRGKYSLPGVRAKFVSETVRDGPSMNVGEYGNTRATRTVSEYDNVATENVQTEHQLAVSKSASADALNHAEQSKDNTETWRNFKAVEDIDAFVTSTPKIARREKSEERLDTVRNSSRPVPTPRKRYSNIELGSHFSGSPRSTPFHADDILNPAVKLPTPQPLQQNNSNEVNKEETSSNRPPSLTKSPPVPKKRRNISKSRTDSDSCFSSLEIREEAEPRETTKVALGAKSNPEIVYKQETPQNLPVSSSDTADSKALSVNHTNISTQNKPETHQLAEEFHKRASSKKRYRKGRSLDDTCIADDELSCFEDGDTDGARDTTLQRRRRSMRKCVSVDDLLRSGSILDRSLILARKRRRRMRDRKCRSQMQLSSSETEDTAELLSARRKAASRERLSSKKDKMATAAATSRSAIGERKQTSGLSMDSSVKGNTNNTRVTFDSTRFIPTASEPKRGDYDFGKTADLPLKSNQTGPQNSSSRPNISSSQQNHGAAELDQCHAEDPSKTLGISTNMNAKPWEIGLLNIGQISKSSSPSSNFVPRWRSGISTSTPSLAEKSTNTGRETVV